MVHRKCNNHASEVVLRLLFSNSSALGRRPLQNQSKKSNDHLSFTEKCIGNLHAYVLPAEREVVKDSAKYNLQHGQWKKKINPVL